MTNNFRFIINNAYRNTNKTSIKTFSNYFSKRCLTNTRRPYQTKNWTFFFRRILFNSNILNNSLLYFCKTIMTII